MNTQTHCPAAGQASTRKSAEAVARIATISDNTRSYLTLLGKLHDCYGEFVELVERDYGPEQVDGFTKDFEGHILELFSIVEKFAISSISVSYTHLTLPTIYSV